MQSKPLNAVMQEALFNAFSKMAQEMRKESNGSPNVLYREMGAIHDNTTVADLPPYLKRKLASAAIEAVTEINSKGYSVQTKS